MTFTKKESFDNMISLPFDSDQWGELLHFLLDRFPKDLSCETIGKSRWERDLQVVTMGSGKKICLLVGTHHGMESVTGNVLVRLIWELCNGVYDSRKIMWNGKSFGYEGLLSEYRYAILPLLNPDGTDLCIHGRQKRFLHKWGLRRSAEYDVWQANSAGVDLNHNYEVGFWEYKSLEKAEGIGRGPTRYAGEHPESEPESRSLATWIRAHRTELVGVLALHTQGEEIYWTSAGETLPGMFAAAKAISKLCGYRLSEPLGLAGYGGLTDYLLRSPGIPAMTLECGKGKNPLPDRQSEAIFTQIRAALILAPFIFSNCRKIGEKIEKNGSVS